MDPYLVQALGGQPGQSYFLGYQQSMLVSGDEPQKLRQKFKGFLSRMEPGPANNPNQLNSRLKAVKEFDAFILKRNHNLVKGLKEKNLNPNIVKGGPNGKYEFPYCLTSAILRVQDLIFKPDLKRENKVEVETMVMRCLQQQRCLIYKIPNFILQFLEQYQDSTVKLNYLEMLTNDGTETDPSFNSQLYIVLLKLVDLQLRPPISKVLNFILNLLQNHPAIFSETQIMQLILKISLVGVVSMEKKQVEIAQEVFQILQFFLKYSDYSPKLMNICLFTMCILSNREPLTYPIWQVLKNLILEKDIFIFHEIVGILQIQQNLAFWAPSGDKKPLPKSHPQPQPGQLYQAGLHKEIQFRCFKGSDGLDSLELNDLQAGFASSTSGSKGDQTFTKRITLCELVCQTECPNKYLEPSQSEEISQLDKRAQKALAKDVQKLISGFEQDRQYWMQYFEVNIDKVFKGAVYFIGKALWGNERLEEVTYPVNQVLKFFKSLITPETKFNLLNEVLTATKMLIINNEIPKYYEWKSVLDILEGVLPHVEVMVQKKRTDLVQDIFRLIRNPLIMDRFPEHLVHQALSVYLKLKNAKCFADKTLTQLLVNYMFKNDFFNLFGELLESCLLKERKDEIRSLFLDQVLDFYSENEDSEKSGILEAMFLNHLEYFYLTRVEGSFSTQQMIQVIDILTYMAHKTEKAASFKHIVEIFEQCILCYDFDRAAISTEPGFLRTDQTPQPKHSIARKDIITSLTQDQIKMKLFQAHALNRLIQIFVLKGQDQDESEKAVYVYNVLLKILKVSANDRKIVILTELLQNLQVNTYRELCWLSDENPLFIEIQTRNFAIFLDDTAQDLNDSQGNSSGSDSIQNRNPARGFGEQQNAIQNRTSFDKLGLDKQIIQCTLKTLVYCYEDLQCSNEIKLNSLRLFHKFMAFISDEDFQNLDYSAVEAGHERAHIPTHLRQAAQVDNKADWVKMVSNFIKQYDPIQQPEFALLTIDIFYSFLSLDACFKLLPPNVIVALVEQFLETLYLVNNHVHKKLKADQMELIAQQLQGGKQDSSRAKQSSQLSRRGHGGSFTGGDIGENLDEAFPSKAHIKVTKKILSLVGFLFTVDARYSATFWNQNAKEIMPYGGHHGETTRGQRHDPEVKLIEYLIDQLTALSLNNHLLFNLTQSILVCTANIAQALKQDPSFQAYHPNIVDHLVFINIRLLLPFTLNKQDPSDMSDPQVRRQSEAYRMNKCLKELFINMYSSFKVLEKYYVKCLTHRSDNHNFLRHLIHSTTSKLIGLPKLSDEYTLQPILILLGQFEQDVRAQVAEIDQQNKGRSKEISKQEGLLRQFVDCLAQNLLWVSHSIYDRACDVSIDQYPVAASNGITHYIWNKNILTLRQIGSKVDLIVRNAAYNYRVTLETANSFAQASVGSSAQVSKLRNILMRQSQGRGHEIVQEVYQHPIDLQKLVLNDATLMALLDPGAHFTFKKVKELLSFPDDPELRKYIYSLDAFQPKNSQCLTVHYVPRHAGLCENLKSLDDIPIYPDYVSEAFLTFLSMLGAVIQIEPENLASNLYLKGLSLEGELSNLVVTEDDQNYVYYVSNVLMPERKVLNSMLASPVQIVYNESNMHDFTLFDLSKIYLVVSKINDSQFRIETQHAFKDFTGQVSDRHDDTSHVLETQASAASLSSTPRGGAGSQFQFEEGQSLKKVSLDKYHNGHLSPYAIVSLDQVGSWIKQVAQLSEMTYRNLRFKHTEHLTSNIMQRQSCIKQIRSILGKQGKPITVLKQ